MNQSARSKFHIMSRKMCNLLLPFPGKAALPKSDGESVHEQDMVKQPQTASLSFCRYLSGVKIVLFISPRKFRPSETVGRSQIILAI